MFIRVLYHYELLIILPLIYSYGSTKFECPNGSFVSRMSTAYDGSERYYKFSCAKFSGINTAIDETCNISESTSSSDDDIYLSCGSDQYTVGIEMIENLEDRSNILHLLCCYSDFVQIRKNDCVDTKFLNDLRRSSTFSSGTQIIRRWQAMLENKDLRWWLQICPVDIVRKKTKSVTDGEIRAKRQVPWEWSRGRFPPMNSFSTFIEREHFLDRKKFRLFDDDKRPIRKLPEVPLSLKQFKNFLNITKTSTNSTRTLPRKSAHEGLFPVLKTSDHIMPKEKLTEKPFSTTTIMPKSKPKEDRAIDYYDTYDEHFDRAKYEGKGSFLSGVSDLLQNLQDGLSIAQAALPNSKKLVYPTSTEPAFLISRDDDSLTIGVKHSTDDKKFNSIVGLQRFGPNPQSPIKSQKTTTSFNLGDPGTIQKMLQFLGLCKGHEL